VSARKPTLDALIAALRDADAALSDAIDKHNEIDEHEFAARKLGGSQIPRKMRNAVERNEGRAHPVVSDALEALCKYRPRTPHELSRYILTLLPHWRIKDASFEDENDRACIAALLANVTGATAAIVFRC
jgi:hypothetical protein